MLNRKCQCKIADHFMEENRILRNCKPEKSRGLDSHLNSSQMFVSELRLSTSKRFKARCGSFRRSKKLVCKMQLQLQNLQYLSTSLEKKQLQKMFEDRSDVEANTFCIFFCDFDSQSFCVTFCCLPELFEISCFTTKS